jgi:hypothetical protein
MPKIRRRGIGNKRSRCATTPNRVQSIDCITLALAEFTFKTPGGSQKVPVPSPS